METYRTVLSKTGAGDSVLTVAKKAIKSFKIHCGKQNAQAAAIRLKKPKTSCCELELNLWGVMQNKGRAFLLLGNECD